MKPTITSLALCVLTMTFQQSCEGDSYVSRKDNNNSTITSGGHRGESHGGNGHDHGHHESQNYVAPPQWNAWDYDWDRSVEYNPPPIAPRPYIPGNTYRPLYPDDEPPQPQLYPSTSLYLPTFILETTTPMVHVGDEIKVSLTVEKGVPPYTVFWKYNQESNWISGTTVFTKQANQRGVITITAIVKDLNEQISHPQSIQVIVLGGEESNRDTFQQR